MKKFFMIAVMAVAALTAKAQAGEFYVTPHIGGGYTTFSDYKEELKGGIAAEVGAEFEYMMSDHFGVSAGVDFLYRMGDKSTFTNDIKDVGDKYVANNVEVQQNFAFLNIPVLAKVHFGGFAVMAGVQPSFMVYANQSSTATHQEISGDLYVDGSIKDNYKSFNLGIPVGISYTFKTPITLDLRYVIPVTKISATDGQYKSNNVKMSAIMFAIGYRF